MTAAGVRYRWQLLRAGPLWLDGGSMFGVVPKVVWNRTVPCDELGRIELAHNCLLLERTDPARANEPRRVLIESGTGDKLDAKTRAIYGLTDYSIADAVREAGVSCQEIDAVILSHLHFDHAGGVTRRLREGEQPDATPLTGGAGVKITFSHAPIYVQRREWEDALANRSTMTRTYLRENLDPIRDRVRLLDSPVPFPQGHRPDRAEPAKSSLADRRTLVLPAIDVFLVPGHTWGQQAVGFTDDSGQTIVFTPDILPTSHHVGAAYNMAYDVEPYTSTITRGWFLQAAVDNDWLLVLDHEAGNPLQRVRSDGKGWFKLEPVQRGGNE